MHVYHTLLLAAGSRHYAYIDASSAAEPSAIAVLDTDVTDHDNGCFCVYLDYHMRGDDVGALAVLSVDASGGYQVEWGVGGGTLLSR